MADPVFVWGSFDGPTCASNITACYEEAVHWKPNLFRLLSGRVGETFVAELSRLFNGYATASALESVALKAAHLLPILVLQKTSKKLKSKAITSHIHRRLTLWQDGCFLDLLREGRNIQHRLPQHYNSVTDRFQLPRTFANLMMEGKVGPAIRLLSNKSKGGVLSLDSPVNTDSSSHNTVRDILVQKHPAPGQITSKAILLAETPASDHDPHFSIFDQIDGDLIRRTALRSSGAAGPSGIDAYGWRRLCTSFRSSPSLCNALAFVARRLCTSYVHPSGLTALVASRLIALDKCPGVRPIGIGETSRRIISKAILSLFNSLNREVALRNSLHLCPSLGRVLTNIYREGACLYIDGEVIRSAEGTTQGDPMAMAMYAVGISPYLSRPSQ